MACRAIEGTFFGLRLLATRHLPASTHEVRADQATGRTGFFRHPSSPLAQVQPRVAVKGAAMYPIMPCDLAAGGLELLCYGFTLVAAFFSYLFMLR
jgi:hypothetical protein